MSTQDPIPARRYAPPRFATLRSIGALILREMSTTYGRSPGGYLWAVLEPVAGIALLSIVFAAAFTAPPLGISFPTFYASGMLLFIMFTDMQSKIALSLLYSRQLLIYPTVTFIDAILARFILNLMTQLLVSYLVIAGCLIAFETRVTLDMPVLVEAYALMAFLSLGIGTLNCYLFTRFPVWQRGWSILMRPMFIISGVFFLYEDMPMAMQDILWWNPLFHIIGFARTGYYATYDAVYVSIPFVLGVSLASFTFGMLLLWRNHRELLTNV